jgi:site-specific DNA recombinase
MRAAIYTRVSTEEQALSGAGLAAQADAARVHAGRMGADVTGMFADEGVSGSVGLEKRPALLEAIGTLGKGDVLIVAKRDRIGRLDPMAMAMIQRAVERKGARIVSAAGEGTSSDDPSEVLMRRMIDAFAEYERLVIGARTSAALQAKKRRGERVGSVPFGKRVGADGHLENDPAEQDVVGLVGQLKTEGLSVRAIASELNRREIPSRGKRWHHTTIQRLLKAA